jgi:hypothetical protein
VFNGGIAVLATVSRAGDAFEVARTAVSLEVDIVAAHVARPAGCASWLAYG